MLRADNAEADNLVRFLKAHKRTTSVDRLTRLLQTIERLGNTMTIRVYRGTTGYECGSSN